MILKDFKPFIGIHCETTATGCLLHQLDISLSEPMMFGLGQGLGFIFWKMKNMDFPFIGGRTRPLALTKNLANNLNLSFAVKETKSVKKAWDNVKNAIDAGSVIGLQLDSYHLEYFGVKIHFAGHFTAMYGYDDRFAYLVDTKPAGGKVKTSLKSLELARNEKGPMAAKNLMYSLNRSQKEFDLSQAIITAISKNAKECLNPPIRNLGYKGMLKTSEELIKWFRKSNNIEYEFCTTAMLMEQAGTGGALFRNMYRDFLKQAYAVTNIDEISAAHLEFIEIAKLWTKVAHLIDETGKTKQESYVIEACEILQALSKKEYSAMKILSQI